MMSERRALLDPEMYKISEEDSQDEEVLASYTEDALKLGVGGGDDITNGNPVLGVGRHSRVSWNSGGLARYSRHEDSLASWEYSGDLSSSQFNPSKLRIVHRNNSHYNQKSSVSSSSPSVRVVANSTGNGEDHDNSVDWPETSTNSDSCLSGDDRERVGGRRMHQHTSSNTSAATSGLGAINNNKFFSRTYFGDNLKHRATGEHDQDENECGAVGGGHTSGTSSVYLEHNSQRPPFPRPQADYQQQHNRSRHFQKRSRRRNARNTRDNTTDLSTSGSDCSDNPGDENGEDDGSSSGSSSSPCTECLSAPRGSGGRHHHRHHHHHRHSHRRNVTSSSEVEEYDSSYSDSSYDDEEDDDDNEDDYDQYYDDDDEGNECFDDIVKFLSDGEVESSTNADGDLFLVEYSADESEERVSLSGPSSSLDSHHRQVPSDLITQQSSAKSRNQSDNEGDRTIERAQVQDPTRRNSQEGSGKQEGDKSSASQCASTSSSSAATGGGHFQKSSSGKGAKGRISRLLKRKRDPPPASKTPGETSAAVPLPSTVTPTVTSTPEMPLTQLFPAASSSSSVILASSSSGNAAHAASGSAILSNQIGISKKQKGSSSAPPSTNSAPEKVFRFKDEHGGETRTVFVDIPQSARTGNLLGRRATLIESILGIIPGHFSTPPPHGVQQNFQPGGSSNNDRIMVAGFVPDGVGSKYRRIKIGDWLQSVDDIPVDHGNVDQVLNSRSMYGKRRTAFETEYLRLKLTLRRVAGCMVSLPPSSSSPQDEEPLESSTIRHSTTTSITEPCWSIVSPQVQSNVAILFISSNSTNSAIEEETSETSTKSGTGNQGGKDRSKDVVYSWPLESESKMVKALASSQGMFSTLYRLLWDVTGSHPVVSKVVIDDCEMDVTYTSDDHGKSLLLIGVATSLSTFTIHHNHSQHDNQQKGKSDKGSGNSGSSSSHAAGSAVASGSGLGEIKKKEKKIRWREPQAGGVTVSTRVLTRVENLLKYQFGSFARAFTESNTDKVNRLLVNSLSALNDLSEDFIFLQVPGNFLRFPNCIRSGIDDVLYSFETSDALHSRPSNKANRSSSSSRRRSKDSTSYGLPVYHCHGSCLMYKGFLITSHLENELASAFHGWWRTQLGLWQGIKRNALLDKWKPVSRLALWQETCILKKHSTSFGKAGNETAPRTAEDNGNDIEAQDIDTPIPPPVAPRLVRCFSGLVGIGNFTLGFVLEHLTDYQGSVGPDVEWLRRAMVTICRLYQSGLSRSFECWLDEKQGGRDEYVELCGTSSVSSSKHSVPPQQEKLGVSSRSATSSLKRVPATGSILKNTEASSVPPHFTCPVHSPNAPVNAVTMTSSLSPTACTCAQANSSPLLKSFMINSSSTSSSSSSSFGGGGGIRPGITGGMTPTSLDELRSIPGNGDPSGGGDSDGGDELDADDTTTGTGSDNSSFKWYERAASEPSFSGSGRISASDVKSIRVTRGNVLLDYMQVEFGRGVMLSSKDIHEGWAAAVRHNFRQSATVIHHILHKAANARQRLEERGNDKKWVSLALAPISEHGILFNCQVTDPRDVHKKKPRKREISYWVVGRIYPDEREIYVCYEDGPLSQNLVEIAYKIALNVHC